MSFKNIVFFGNCQAQMLASVYREFFGAPGSQSVSYISSYAEIAGAKDILELADAVIVQEFDFQTKIELTNLRPGARRFTFPSAVAGFLWPFGSKPHPRNEPLPWHRTGPYPAQLGEGYLNRLLADKIPLNEAVDQYLELDVAKKANLDRLYELYIDRQRKRDQFTGFNIASVIENNFRLERLFLTPDHPYMPIFSQMAEPVFGFLGISATNTKLALQKLRRSPFPADELPIHPAVGKHFGMNYVDENTEYNYLYEGGFTFEQYARRYYQYEWNSELQEGIWLSHGADPERALRVLDVGLASAPKSLMGLCRRSSLLARLNRRADAIETARMAAELWPHEPEGHTALAERMREDRDLVAAEAAARRAIEVCPVDVHGHRVLSSILDGSDRAKDAIAVSRTLITLQPGSADSYVTLGRQLEVAGEVNEALICFRRACELEPNNINIFYSIIDFLINSGQISEAESELKGLLIDFPQVAGLQSRLAALLIRQNDLNGAEMALKRAISIEPNALSCRRQLADVLVRQGRLADAGDALEGAITIAPLDPHLHAALSKNYIRRGDLASAEESVKRAVELLPQSGALWCDLADVASLRGRGQDALALARRAIEVEPTRQSSHGYLGHQLIRNGLLDEAERVLRQALDMDPRLASAQRNLAAVLARKGMLNEAVAVLRAWLEKSPNDLEAQIMVGQYLASLGRNLLREAEVALRTAVGLGPDNIAARIGLIEVLTSLERGPEAAEEIRAGLSLRPRDARLVTLAARHRLETNAV